MKRLLIATFLLIVSLTIYAVTAKAVKKAPCVKSQETCCLKKSKQAPYNKTNHIFWEPVSRLILIQK